MRKTAEEILAKKANKTLEEVNDSEPFYLHQGEVLGAMRDFASQEVSFAVEKALAMAAERGTASYTLGKDANGRDKIMAVLVTSSILSLKEQVLKELNKNI